MAPGSYLGVRVRVPGDLREPDARGAASMIPWSELRVAIAAAHRSLRRLTRAGIVSIVKRRGSSEATASDQRSGVETVACGFARTEYTPATVFARMFCR